MAIDGTDPQFEHENINGKADPESDPEELLHGEVGGAAGGEEYTHYGARGCDAEKDCDGAEFPAAGQNGLGISSIQPCSCEREEKERVEEENCRALDPSANGVCAHGISGETDNCAETVEGCIDPGWTRRAPEYDDRCDENEEQSRDNVGKRDGSMRRKGVVKASHLRGSAG